MIFEATYYNGKTASPITAEVRIEKKGLVITTTSETHESNEVDWDHTYITHSEVENKVILRYGKQFPYQTIEIYNPEFWEEIKRINPNVPYLKSQNTNLSTGLKFISFAVLAVVGIALLVYFFLIPMIMTGAAEIFPRDLEVKLGKSMNQSMLNSEEIDTQRTKAINKLYGQLKVPTDYKINITVVKKDIQNAYALPGGEIVVYSAILDSMKSYEELIALLGHETGHIEKRHTLKMLFKSLSNYLIISAIFQDASGIMAVLIDNASSVEQLSYNRAIETESDEFGYEVLRRNKINPQGMVQLFEQLNKEGSDDVIPEFMSTHPKLKERIIETKKRIKEISYKAVPNDSLAHYFMILKDRATH